MFGHFFATQLAWSPAMFVPVESLVDERGEEGAQPRRSEDGGEEVVVVRTCGAAGSECFVLQRRKCYWAILDVRRPQREVA